MDLVSGYKGVVGLVFGNGNSASNEDSYVERLLDRISNGTLAEDRRMAMTELLSVVSESNGAQLAFGAMGFPVLMSVLKEESGDVEMVRAALETLVSALTPIGHGKAPKNQVQPALMNADLLSREAESISILLSLLPEEDFYIRYYALQLLTALLTNSPNRLQEAILTVPRGITQLMDMLLDREVIRNEALLLLTYLTNGAEEIQKIVVFEGVFEKIFSIIREEGGSDGGVVVQDCLELLKNLLRKNSCNQVLLRETVNFDQLISVLKIRGSSYSFTQQKTINLLSLLEIITLLIVGDSQDANCFTNKTILVQKKVMDHLLVLGVESRWAPTSVRCMALRSIGNLIAGHQGNLHALSSTLLGEEPQVEPALNSILRIALRASSMQEFIAADYVLGRFCENNPNGQMMLASTLIPEPQSRIHSPVEEDVNMSFGSILLHGLTPSENNADFETCTRAASILSHVLLGNIHCKEKVLKIKLEAPPIQSLQPPEPLMNHIVKYLALVSNVRNIEGIPSKSLYTSLLPIILKLLVIWLAECPSAVHCFLDSRSHLTYLVELVESPSANACIRGLAAVLLGECILYNRSSETNKDAFAIVDAIAKSVSLTTYFLKFDEMRKDIKFSAQIPYLQKPFSRSNDASVADVENADEGNENDKTEYHTVIVSIFNAIFCSLIEDLEGKIREIIVNIYSQPKNEIALVPVELEKEDGENNQEYIKRLKAFVKKQCAEIQELLDRNATLAEDLARSAVNSSYLEGEIGGGSRLQMEKLRRDLQEALKQREILFAENARLESDASKYKNLAEKAESELKSLSDAYNSLEQAHFQLEKDTELPNNGATGSVVDIEAIREEVQKENESELSDLLVCLGQEQSKVDRLSHRLIEMGEDVGKLLQGITDDVLLPDDDEDS